MTHSIEPASGNGKTLRCPICRQQFTCALSSTCWCSTRTVPTKVKEYLAEQYAKCICSTCLDRLIEEAGTGESA